jgi:hypothetical protein
MLERKVMASLDLNGVPLPPSSNVDTRLCHAPITTPNPVTILGELNHTLHEIGRGASGSLESSHLYSLF